MPCKTEIVQVGQMTAYIAYAIVCTSLYYTYLYSIAVDVFKIGALCSSSYNVLQSRMHLMTRLPGYLVLLDTLSVLSQREHVLTPKITALH